MFYNAQSSIDVLLYVMLGRRLGCTEKRYSIRAQKSKQYKSIKLNNQRGKYVCEFC